MRKLFLPVLGLLVIVALALVPLSASAASATTKTTSHRQHHHPHFFFKHGLKQQQRSIAAASNNLNYNGGPVMGGTVNAFAIFWEPTGNVSTNYHSLIERYFGDIGGSGLYNNNTQYTDSGGNVPSNAVLGGTFVDNSPYPESPLLDSDIQNEVTRAMQVNGWSSSIDNIFFVYLERNQDLCFDSSLSQCASNTFCAYHSFFGSNTIYAAMPYAASFSCDPGSSPNNDDADQVLDGTSHEQMEAATDPLLNAWFDAQGQEIGDKCNFTFGTVGPDGANVHLGPNNDPYILQQEWDNNVSGCVIDGP